MEQRQKMTETKWTRQPLRVSGRYFMEGDKPFFWLGDTAWLLFHRLNLEEAYQYLRNRKELGFHVIQAVLVNSVAGDPVMDNEVLHYPGSGQMQYLKGLMESVDFTAGRPGDELLLFGQKERYHRIAVFAGEDFILCYDYMGDEFLLDLTKYMDQTMDIWWMNPQSGACSYAGAVKGEDRWQASPLRRKGDSNDWVLVMRRR